MELNKQIPTDSKKKSSFEGLNNLPSYKDSFSPFKVNFNTICNKNNKFDKKNKEITISVDDIN